MKQNEKNMIFKNIDTKVVETGVVDYINNNGLKKFYNCSDCEAKIGATCNCYECLLQDSNVREKFEKMISLEKTLDLYSYHDILMQKAEQANNQKLKRLADITESFLYLNLL